MKWFSFTLLNTLLNILLLVGGFYLTFSEAGKTFIKLPDIVKQLKKSEENTKNSIINQISSIKNRLEKSEQSTRETLNYIKKINNGYNPSGFKKICIAVSEDNSSKFYFYYDKASGEIDNNIQISNYNLVIRNTSLGYGKPILTLTYINTTIGKQRNTPYAFSVSRYVYKILTNNDQHSLYCGNGNIEYKLVPINN